MEKTSTEVFWKSSLSLLNAEICLRGLLLQLKNNSKTFNINEKTSIEDFFRNLFQFNSGFWSNICPREKTSRELLKKSSLKKSNIVNCKSNPADFLQHWEDFWKTLKYSPGRLPLKSYTKSQNSDQLRSNSKITCLSEKTSKEVFRRYFKFKSKPIFTKEDFRRCLL